MALLSPGPRSRLQALREAVQGSIRILYGAAAMLLVAALIEAFWSSSTLFPASIKIAVGVALWLAVAT